MSTPLNVIPTRFVRFSTETPANHCSVAQVMAALRGLMPLVQQQFQDTAADLPEGADAGLTAWQSELSTYVIPEVSSQVVSHIGQPLDWCRSIWFFDGPAGDALSLPYRYLYDVNLCYLRVIPSLPFYGFQRMRNVDGTEFSRILGVEPLTPAPEIIPPLPITAQYSSSLIWTGTEDADLMVDTRRREIRIPPRVLVAGVGLPVANFQFLRGTMNVEVHFRFGFPPTAYTDGSPLQFDNVNKDVNGNYPLINPKPQSNPPIYVDWSSGMPPGVSMKVARLVANKVKRQLFSSVSNGLSSMSVEGASESYRDARDLDAEDARLLSELEKFGLVSVI